MTLPNPQVSSTCSNWVGSFILVRPTGFEPAAFRVGVLSPIRNVRKMFIFVENRAVFGLFCVYYLHTKVLTC